MKFVNQNSLQVKTFFTKEEQNGDNKNMDTEYRTYHRRNK